MGISENKSCNCKTSEKVKGDDIFSPLKGKMKVLKKIKRRMGLASRSSSNGGGTNNLPPLLFHNVHGENIRISRDGTVAKRVESFCKGIAFSSRAVKVNEKICIKFLEISNNWSGVIRFGFTYNDPSTMRYGLPKYACPDLTNKPGYWAKALPERFCSQTTVLFYYVTSTGDVHFGINGEEKGIFFSGVETRGPLYALIDVYGNSTAIEFVDIRHQLNNSRRNVTPSCDTTPEEIDRIIGYPMQQIHIQQQQREQNEENQRPLVGPTLRHQPSHLYFNPMMLHRTRGRNVRFGNMQNNAYRTDTEFCQGYVFTGRPLQLGERIVVQVLATEPMFQGCLGLGLTSCDPATLQTSDLPDDSNFLLDRPEYWVISRDFSRNLNKGDEISFSIQANGEVQISRNGEGPAVVIHVDQTLRLWAFFDIYGSTQRIRVLSSPAPVVSPVRNNYNDRRIISPTESMNSLNSQNELRRNSSYHQHHHHQQHHHQPSNNNGGGGSNSTSRVLVPADIQLQPASNGGAVLSVILPPQHANLINHHQQNGQVAVLSPPSSAHNHHHHQNGHDRSSHYGSNGHQMALSQQTIVAPVQVVASPVSLPQTTSTMVSSCSSTYVEPVSDSSSYSTPIGWTPTDTDGAGTALAMAGAECTICYENSIDAVLYMCGHMCMCYECALQQWRGKGGGHCPLCRAVIRDVIRTYKS